MSEEGPGFDLLPQLLWETARRRAVPIVAFVLPTATLLFSLGVLTNIEGKRAPIGLLNATHGEPKATAIIGEVAGLLAAGERSSTLIPARVAPGEKWCIEPWTPVLAIGGDEAIVQSYAGMCRPQSLIHIVLGLTHDNVATFEGTSYRKIAIRIDDLTATLKLLEQAGFSRRIGIILGGSDAKRIGFQTIDRGNRLASQLRSRGYRIARVTHHEAGRERLAIDIAMSTPTDLKAWGVDSYNDSAMIAWEVAIPPAQIARKIVKSLNEGETTPLQIWELDSGLAVRKSDVPFWSSPLEP